MKQLNILLLLFFSLNSFAQSGIMKWNSFPLSDLKMTEYELDKEASAVVLGQKAHAKFKLQGDSEMMVYDYHIRIKILSKAGLDQATIKLPYYSEDRLESIGGIKATTANLKNGQIVTTKLEKNDIFNEKVSDFVSQKKFTMPAVEVGSIIEYKYEMTSKRTTLLEDFYFQREIPVKWAELNFEVPEFFEYIFLTQTSLPFHIKTQKSKSYSLGAQYKNIRGTEYQWVIKDAPAVVQEDFITTINDHRQRMSIQLKKVYFPGRAIQNIFSTWGNLRKELMESSNFGLRFTRGHDIRKVSAFCPAVGDASMDEQQRIKEIYEFVQSRIKWNGKNGYMVNQSFMSLLEAQTGDAADINLMLLALLQQAGFNANPVLLSTRKHGRPTTIYPIVKQFNYVIVEVIIDNKILLLDAVDPTLPIGMVSFRCLNNEGWSLRGSQGTWIKIPAQKALKIVQISLQLQEDGSATGFMKSIYNGYEAVDQRKEALSSNEEEYLEERIKKDIPNIKIDSLVFENTKKIGEKFYETIHFTIPEAAEVAGNMIYLNPFLNEGWEENPFKLKERTYPIDLGYPMYEQIIINITPPKGYVIDELPENTLVGLLETGGSFKFLSNKLPNGDTQIISKLQLKNSQYYPNEYQFVKQFFDMVIDKHSTQLVYKKAE